jgi:hypothetical protein
MSEIMDGAWSAKKFIVNYLAEDIPNRMIAYRNRWNLDDVRLPTPSKFLGFEPPALDEWPCIYTLQAAARDFERADFNADMEVIYSVTYTMRTYVWARDVGLPEGPSSAEQVTEIRDRLTTVVRAALLDHPSMQKAASIYFPELDVDILMDETSLREEYSDVTYAKGDRAIAGAYLAYDFRCYERIQRRTIGTASSYEISTVPLEWD